MDAAFGSSDEHLIACTGECRVSDWIVVLEADFNEAIDKLL